jgi:hypothetical protein
MTPGLLAISSARSLGKHPSPEQICSRSEVLRSARSLDETDWTKEASSSSYRRASWPVRHGTASSDLPPLRPRWLTIDQPRGPASPIAARRTEDRTIRWPHRRRDWISGYRGFGNPDWQSNGDHPRDPLEPRGRMGVLRATTKDRTHELDKPDRPPEPVAQVRVLPGALFGPQSHETRTLRGRSISELFRDQFGPAFDLPFLHTRIDTVPFLDEQATHNQGSCGRAELRYRLQRSPSYDAHQSRNIRRGR